MLEAAFSLPIGKVSEPVKTDDGYYLVYVSGIEPTPDKPTVQRRMLGAGLPAITAETSLGWTGAICGPWLKA